MMGFDELMMINLIVAIGIAIRFIMLRLMVKVVMRLMVINLWVVSVSDLLNDSIKSVMLVCGVLNHTLCAVRFIQTIFALHNIAVANFPLAFVVACVSVFYAIFEFVLGISVVILVIIRSISR